jgi:cytochrome P450
MAYYWVLLFLKLGLCSASFYAAYWVYWEITVGSVRRQFIKQHGCKPGKQVLNRDPILGLDLIFQFLRWRREHRILEQLQLLYTRLNRNTYVLKIMRQQLIFTTEVENIKTILSLNFDSWGIGKSREIMVPFLGRGIFSADGVHWRHSRDMLRPIFVRSQLNDVSMLEYHVKHIIQAIPRDGSTVDLQKLFTRLTLDIATELLFGESTNDLSSNSKGESAEFIAAFNRCLNVLGGNTDRGIFALLLPNPGYKRDCKLIHSQSTRLVVSIEQALSLPSCYTWY